jgi:hypothetical protein
MSTVTLNDELKGGENMYSTKRKGAKGKKSGYTDIEKTAFKIGLVETAITAKEPNRISASYVRGLSYARHNNENRKMPLFPDK